MIRAAISISAALVETWFLGDLLGIAFPLALSTLGVSWSCSSVAVPVLVVSGMIFGELMGFSSLLPLMYMFPSDADTTYELPSFLFRMTCTLSLIHI